MRGFFLFSLIYLGVAVAIVAIFHETPSLLIADATTSTLGSLEFFRSYFGYISLFVAAILWITRHHGLRRRMQPAFFAFAGCLIFATAFSMYKTTIPYLVPFYADPMLAQIDQTLHFGTQTWEIVHRFSGIIPADAVVFLYFFVWSIPAAFLPLIIALTDPDEDRAKRFTQLYVICGVCIGNVMAALGSSVGPIYYDRLLGTSEFSGLTQALKSSGIEGSMLGGVQQDLWDTYAQAEHMIGSGISAYPSVHVGIAAVTALYLMERHPKLAFAGFGFLGAILFCSVYIGWHYAIDGYTSIAIIFGAWAYLRRRDVAFASTVAA